MRGGKRDAQQKLAELVASVGRGTFVEPSETTIAAHVRARIDVWHSAGKIGDTTCERYRVLLAKQIVPHVGDIALQRLTTSDVEKWHATLGSTGLYPADGQACARRPPQGFGRRRSPWPACAERLRARRRACADGPEERDEDPDDGPDRRRCGQAARQRDLPQGAAGVVRRPPRG